MEIKHKFRKTSSEYKIDDNISLNTLKGDEFVAKWDDGYIVRENYWRCMGGWKKNGNKYIVKDKYLKYDGYFINEGGMRYQYYHIMTYWYIKC